ncbi:MAG: type VII toxin-antitoxin system HepT family RNase toxin [Pseudonocardia sp.]
MVDPLRVRSMLDRLGAEITALRRLAARSTEELLGDDDLLAAVKYRFVIAIEVCIDAGRHIVASEGLRAPLDYADVFTVLAEASLLAADVTADMRDTARFRNLLVHGYAQVDDDRVVEILRTRLDDLERFRVALAEAALR